jgi:low temperature requirement protein LtrA
VTTTELFFDLVYVFAVTQLSHLLLTHLTPRGALETAVLLAAVWWGWNSTAWATNWVDPDRPIVRSALIVLMLLSLLMSAAIPEAFRDRGLQFAGAFVAMGVLRGAFMVFALRGTRMSRNYAQLTAWTAIAGVAWFAGGLVDDADARMGLWILAVVLDYAAPLHGFVLPLAGRTPTADWTLSGGHLAERGQLVILIALGESLLSVGATFAEIEQSAAVVFAFVVGFLMSVSLWGVYFIRSADEGARVVAGALDPTRVARSAYAYAHGLMVGGIIVTAVGIDLAIAHPTGETATSTAATILGGPGLYLLGNALFNWSLTSVPPTSRLSGVAVLAALSPVALVAGPAALLAFATLVVLVLALATGRPH